LLLAGMSNETMFLDPLRVIVTVRHPTCNDNLSA
jgi:hypothetical protein